MFLTNFNKNKIIIKKTKSNSGFVMLFAVLLASFLVTLGVSIISISLKEIQMATAARDSQIAYYVADSARECLLYWDVKMGVFPTCLGGNDGCNINSIPPSGVQRLKPDVICNGNTPFTLSFEESNSGLTYTATSTTNTSAPFFQASSTLASAPVADVIITKNFIPNFSSIVTTIKAYGHNTSIFGRRVERAIQTINN